MRRLWHAALRWLLAMAMGLPIAVCAHKPSDAYLQLQVRGAVVEQRFDIALRDLERDLALDDDDDGRLTWQEVRSRWNDIAQFALQGATVQADGLSCRPEPAQPAQLDEHSDGRYAVVLRQWTCPAAVRQVGVSYALFAQTDPTHRGIARLQSGDRTETAVLSAGAGPHRFATVAEDATPRPQRVAGFVEEGIHHILIGTDHILFLLALLLPAVLMRKPGTAWEPAPAFRPVLTDVLKVVTAFTVAHSVTLALAAFDVVDPPSRWVESVIAASVVLAAVNNLFPVIREGRWKLTFAFGLVHGFGFASALKDLGLRQGELAVPVVAFNLGVELGQLGIVALFLLGTWRLRGTRLYRHILFKGGSVAIAAMACLWLVERAFDLQWAWLQ